MSAVGAQGIIYQNGICDGYLGNIKRKYISINGNTAVNMTIFSVGGCTGSPYGYQIFQVGNCEQVFDDMYLSERYQKIYVATGITDIYTVLKSIGYLSPLFGYDYYYNSLCNFIGHCEFFEGSHCSWDYIDPAFSCTSGDYFIPTLGPSIVSFETFTSNNCNGTSLGSCTRNGTCLNTGTGYVKWWADNTIINPTTTTTPDTTTTSTIQPTTTSSTTSTTTTSTIQPTTTTAIQPTTTTAIQPTTTSTIQPTTSTPQTTTSSTTLTTIPQTTTNTQTSTITNLPTSTTTRTTTTDAQTTQVGPYKLPDFAIALIVLGGLIFIITLVIVIIWSCDKKKKKEEDLAVQETREIQQILDSEVNSGSEDEDDVVSGPKSGESADDPKSAESDEK